VEETWTTTIISDTRLWIQSCVTNWPYIERILIPGRLIFLSQGPQLCRALKLNNNRKLFQKIQVSSTLVSNRNFILYRPQFLIEWSWKYCQKVPGHRCSFFRPTACEIGTHARRGSILRFLQYWMSSNFTAGYKKVSRDFFGWKERQAAILRYPLYPQIPSFSTIKEALPSFPKSKGRTRERGYGPGKIPMLEYNPSDAE